MSKEKKDTLLGTVKKALTHNRCDSCGFTKEQVYLTELFTESGLIVCKPCYDKSFFADRTRQPKDNIINL